MINKRFYISKSGELAYLNIAKSGCTAIKVALSEIRNSSPERGSVNVHNPADYDLVFLDVLSPDNRVLENIFKFTFVRNPVERTLSFHRNKMLAYDESVTPYYESKGMEYGCDADTFIRKLVTLDPEALEEHLYPQARTVFDGTRCLVDWVGKLESMGSDWPKLMEVIGRQADVRVINQTVKDDRSSIREESLEMLKEYYREDGYCFGYFEQGPVTDELKEKRAIFESRCAGAGHSGQRIVGPDWQLVNRTYLENIHSQLAHLRRQVAGVNGRLDRLNVAVGNMDDDRAKGEKESSTWIKWFRRSS